MSDEEPAGIAIDELLFGDEDGDEEEDAFEPAPEPAPAERPQLKREERKVERPDPASRAGGGVDGMKELTVISNTHRFLRAAITPFTYAGDHLGSGEYIVVDPPDEPIRLRALPAARLDEIEHGYEEPDRFAMLLDRVRHRRTIVLRGPAGHGKRATALRLLSRLEARA